MKLSAVIFDLNGTVINDDRLWDDAYGKVLGSLGLDYKEGQNHICGMSIDDNWRILVSRYKIKTDKTAEELSVLTNKEYLKHMSEIEVRDGFEELAKNFTDAGIPVGLATSSTWEMVDETFKATGIENYFDFVTTSEEVNNSKPSPDIFDLAGEKMGTPPEECLVIEDSESGVEGAKAAGMKVIGIYRSEEHKNTLKQADALVSGFGKVTPELIDSI